MDNSASDHTPAQAQCPHALQRHSKSWAVADPWSCVGGRGSFNCFDEEPSRLCVRVGGGGNFSNTRIRDSKFPALDPPPLSARHDEERLLHTRKSGGGGYLGRL